MLTTSMSEQEATQKVAAELRGEVVDAMKGVDKDAAVRTSVWKWEAATFSKKP